MTIRANGPSSTIDWNPATMPGRSDRLRRNRPKLFSLSDLARIIETRADAGAEASYTASLLAKGPPRCAKKFGEEAVELAIAAVGQDQAAVRAEAADALYHLLVLIKSRGVTLDEVLEELERRTAQSGLAEKASRRA